MSKAGVLVASAAVFGMMFAALWLTFAVVAAAWRGLGFVTALIFPILGFPQVGADMALGLRAALGFIAAIALVSAVLQNAFAILSLAIASLGLGATVCARAAFIGAVTPGGFGVRSRSSAIGGGQAEWQISSALLYAILALALAGGSVALAAAALRPASPLVAAPAHPSAARGAKEESGGAAAGEASSEPAEGEPKPKTSPTTPAEK